jgi:hypothetical protein
MRNINPSDNVLQLSSPAIKKLAEHLKSEMPSEKMGESLIPLDKSLAGMPEEYGIKDKLESMLMHTIVQSIKSGESVYKVYAVCASVIAGASIVVSSIYEE